MPREEEAELPHSRGGDYNAELHLDLKDVYTTQKRELTINGKKIRLTIPAGVENGQVIKIAGMEPKASMAVQKAIYTSPSPLKTKPNSN